MAKVMLVEDDNNLRQIYEDRLAAEGYQIVSAKDGEEALALAVKERPDLIIADIMMPKVSGFDMLDILRSTPETKDAKIIMMTALSQSEDKNRAEQLGADRYLVKSQVTLEDVANVANEMLSQQKQASDTAVSHMVGQTPAPTAPAAPPSAPTTETPAAPAPAPEPPSAPAPPPTPSIPVSTPPADEPTATASSAPKSITVTSDDDDDEKDEVIASTVTPETPAEPKPADEDDEFIASNPTLSASPEPAKPADEPAGAPALNDEQSDKVATAVDGLLKETEHTDTPSAEIKPSNSNNYVAEDNSSNSDQAMTHAKRIEPMPDTTTQPPNLNELLAKEAAAETAAPPAVNTVISPTNGAAPAAPAPSGTMNDVTPAPAGSVSPAPASPDNVSL